MPRQSATSVSLLLLTAPLVLGIVFAQPPPGPKDRAICPVTGKTIDPITKNTPSVEFTHGQRLFFATEVAAKAYVESPRDYWLAPHDLPLPGVDGKRGLPDLRNETRLCPSSGENITIEMQTPRVVHKHGQNLYFCCFGCVMGFWTDPAEMIVGVMNRTLLP